MLAQRIIQKAVRNCLVSVLLGGLLLSCVQTTIDINFILVVRRPYYPFRNVNKVCLCSFPLHQMYYCRSVGSNNLCRCERLEECMQSSLLYSNECLTNEFPLKTYDTLLAFYYN